MYRKLLKNISLISLGTLASKIIVYLMIPLYTSILTTEEYGVTDLIFTTVSLLMPLISMEISNALMRFLLDKDYDNNTIFSCCSLILFVSILIFIICIPILYCVSVFKNYILLVGIYYFTNLINGYVQCMARGIDLVKEYSIAGIIQTLFTVLFNILFLIVIPLDITGYLMAYSFGAAVSAIYLIIIIKIRKNIKFDFKLVNKTVLYELLAYSIPLIPNSLLWWISNSSDKYILTLFKGVSEVGIYSVAYKIPTILTVLSSIFITAWQISSVDDFGSESNRMFFRDIFKKYLFLTVTMTMAINLFLKIICGFMFSKNFYSAWEIVPILLIGFVYYNMSVFYGTIYTAAKKTKMVMISTLIGSLLNIILNFILIPKWGMYGASIATTISYIVIYFMRKYDTKKFMDLEIKNIDIIYGILMIFQILTVYNNLYILNIICIIIMIFIFLLSQKGGLKRNGNM